MQTTTDPRYYEKRPTLVESVPAARAGVLRHNLDVLSGMFMPGGPYSKPKEAESIQAPEQSPTRAIFAENATKAIVEKPNLQPVPTEVPETRVVPEAPAAEVKPVQVAQPQAVPTAEHLGDAMEQQQAMTAQARSDVEAAFRKVSQ